MLSWAHVIGAAHQMQREAASNENSHASLDKVGGRTANEVMTLPQVAIMRHWHFASASRKSALKMATLQVTLPVKLKLYTGVFSPNRPLELSPDPSPPRGTRRLPTSTLLSLSTSHTPQHGRLAITRRDRQGRRYVVCARSASKKIHLTMPRRAQRHSTASCTPSLASTCKPRLF